MSIASGGNARTHTYISQHDESRIFAAVYCFPLTITAHMVSLVLIKDHKHCMHHLGTFMAVCICQPQR